MLILLIYAAIGLIVAMATGNDPWDIEDFMLTLAFWLPLVIVASVLWIADEIRIRARKRR